MEMGRFTKELERVLSIWPSAAVWKLHQIAMYTGGDYQETCELYGNFKNKPAVKHDKITKEEGVQFLQFCNQKLQEGISAVSVEDQVKQKAALKKAKELISKIEKVKKENKHKEAINTYYYMIGELQNTYPDIKQVANWYMDVSSLILETGGNQKEAVQNLIKAAKCFYKGQALEEVKNLYDSFKEKIASDEISEYLISEIRKIFTNQEYLKYFS